MIVQHAQVVMHEASNHVGQALLGTTGGTLVFGLTIGQLNPYLQAGAFVATMVTGVCAALYYTVHTYYKIRNKGK